MFTELNVEIQNSNTKYNTLFKSYIDLNKNKINKIKEKMSELVQKPYLDYLFEIIQTSFQIDKTVYDLCKDIDNFFVHPMIFEQVFCNLTNSHLINKLIQSTSNSENKSNLLDDIGRTYNEIQIAMEIFDNIYKEVDNEFINQENAIGYNNFHIIMKQSNNLLIWSELSDNDKLNYMLYMLENSVSNVLADYSKALIKISNKFDDDNTTLYNFLQSQNKIYKNTNLETKVLENIEQTYMLAMTTTYNALMINDKYNFKEIDIPLYQIQSHFKKNIVFFWLDLISEFNGQKLIKNKYVNIV